MAQVLVEIHGKAYGVGCEDGQESQVRALAEIIDTKAREVAPDAAVLGETRTMLLAALMLANELQETRERLSKLENTVADLQGSSGELEARAVAAIEAVAQKLEALAAR